MSKTPRTQHGWRWPVAGLLAGAAWGGVARAWMRYVSTDPEFSWSGTLAIVGMTTLAGTALGGVEALRRGGARSWRRLLAVPALLMFAGPGLIMLPTAVFGALALSGRGGRGLRPVAAVLALAPLSFFFLADESHPHSLWLTLAWYLVLCVGLAVGWLPVMLPRITAEPHPVPPKSQVEEDRLAVTLEADVEPVAAVDAVRDQGLPAVRRDG